VEQLRGQAGERCWPARVHVILRFITATMTVKSIGHQQDLPHFASHLQARGHRESVSIIINGTIRRRRMMRELRVVPVDRP
jgi:hypothetical protein